MKKLLLINPVAQKSGYLMSRYTTFAPLGLGYVAAVTPPTWEVQIIDEHFESFSYLEADLVGISAFTSSISRAYDIATVYRERGTKVVLGGIHASMFFEEAQKYSDAVVIGEVEGIWATVLEDFEKGQLKALYRGPRIDLNDFEIRPRRDLFDHNYFWQSIQTSRGCPFDCSFCSVSRYLGKEYRQRTATSVLEELCEVKGRYIAFVDDNLIGYRPEERQRARDIFQGMIRLNLRKKWWMQTSINAAEHEETVELAAKAGCMFVFIGFETLSTESLKKMKKGVNERIGIENYKGAVDVFHKFGIGVLGAFIIGNDHESTNYYKQLADFIVASGIDVVQISILTPLPGTRLLSDMKNQKRLIYQNFPQDWNKYRFSYMVHNPVGIKPESVYVGNNYIKHRIYTFPDYPRRLVRSFLGLKNFRNFVATYMLNRALKKSWMNAHYYNEYRNSL